MKKNQRRQVIVICMIEEMALYDVYRSTCLGVNVDLCFFYILNQYKGIFLYS